MRTIRLWGYCRASQRRQDKSPEDQEHDIQKAVAEQASKIASDAADACGEECRCEFFGCRKEHKSATKIPFTKRPEFVKLMQLMRKGDHLFVWRLDRGDRDPFRMGALITWTVNAGICLHILDYENGRSIDLSNRSDRLWLQVSGIVSDGETGLKREASQRCRRRLEEAGKPTDGMPRFGFRRVWQQVGTKRKLIALEPSHKERKQIREIYERRERGEMFSRIARDFDRRGLTTADDERWTYRRPNGYFDIQRVRNAYRWYAARVASGEGFPTMPTLSSLTSAIA